jgi:hypothetical protein
MDDVSSLVNRSRCYYNIDGVGELGIGFMCLSVACLQWMQLRAPENSFWNKPYTVLIFFLGIAAVIKYGSEAIKKRITYPRTGLVEYRKRDTVWIPLATGAVASFAISALVGLAQKAHWQLTAPAALIGLLLAASYAHGFARATSWKWIVAIVMAITSIAMALAPPEGLATLIADSWLTRHFSPNVVAAVLITFGVYGVLLLLSGGISFALYLRAHTPGDEA